MASFPDRMRALRGEMSRRKAGHLLDIREEQIKKFEDGTASPSLRSLHRIADQTGASIDYITGRSDEFSGPPKWWLTEESSEPPEAEPPARPGHGVSPSVLADVLAAEPRRAQASPRRRKRGQERA